MPERLMNEADTRANLIDPALQRAGWGPDRITREHFFYKDRQYTDGRPYLVGNEARRKEPRRADYLLRYADAIPIAIVEAKDESHEIEAAIQEAKGKAQSLGIPFAYSTNGHGFAEFDFLTNTQRNLTSFPPPEKLWERYTAYQAVRDMGGTSPLLHPYCPENRCGKEPRYYQETAIGEVLLGVMQGKKRLLLAMATGSGKTFVAFQAAWKLLKSGWFHRVLFITDRNFLRDNAFNEFGPFEDGRFIIEKGKVNRNRDIYFSSYQSLWSEHNGKRLFEAYPQDFFDLIVIDECHRSGFGTWNEILRYFSDAVHLGMTATPKRTDNIDTYAYFSRETDGTPVYEYSIGRGIDDGFLATYKVHNVRTNVDQAGLHIYEARLAGAEITVPEGASLRDYYHTPQFEREIRLPDRTEKMSEHLAGLLGTFDPMERTIVFCVDQDHAARVAFRLQNSFAHLGYPNYAVRIVSEEPEARELFEQFRDSDRKLPVVATTVDLLTTGVDVPSVRNIVFMTTVSSPHWFKQMFGRGTRIDPATGKLWFRVIDYTNSTRLLDEWDRPEPEPVVVSGPRDSSIEGSVYQLGTEDPISNALVTVQGAPNEQVQQRTDVNGRFSFDELPEGALTVHVSATGYRPRMVTVEVHSGTPEVLTMELLPKGEPVRKIEVRGLAVHIAEETIIIIESTGQQLTIKDYLEYTAEVVKNRSPSLDDLREIWVNPEARHDFLEALEGESVHLTVLQEVLDQPAGDQFDILAHIAFEEPIHTRDERSVAFLNQQQSFLGQYNPEAQEVLLSLLEKYRIGGVDELAKPEIFRVSPFDQMGQAPGVIQRFGDASALSGALSEMQKRLYNERRVEIT